MRRARSLGGRRDLDQSKAQRTARPMVPDRSRSSKHVRIPPLSAAFPRRSACTKKQLVARGGSPHARNGHPIDSEASAVAQEAAFFATRKLSLHRRRLRRCSAPTVAPKPRCEGSMDRCVGMAARCCCVPTQSVADKHALRELRSRRPAQCHAHPGYCPHLVGRVLAPVSRDDRSSRAHDAAIEHFELERIAVRRPARERQALREV